MHHKVDESIEENLLSIEKIEERPEDLAKLVVRWRKHARKA